MLPVLEKVMHIVQPLGLAVLLVYTYGLLQRAIGHAVAMNMLMGAMFGIAALVAMLSPIQIADGIFVDLRSLFVGVAGAFFGFLGGFIALSIAAMTRITLGGDGTMLGLYGLAISFIMGIVWANFVRPWARHTPTGYLVLGSMISCYVSVGWLLPPTVRTDFFVNVMPTLVVANVLGAMLLGQLITRERDLIDEARRLASEATTDPLTKLANRATAAAVFSDLPRFQNRHHGQTMICIDVDRFKTINDQHGHLRGDKVLVDIAARLSACVRPNDILSRISGDEFLIVLHDIDPDQARRVADRCLAAVNEAPVIADKVEIDVSISVGAVWTDRKPSFTAFREIADEALYRAKDLGRNCVSFEIASSFDQQPLSLSA